MTVDDFKKVLLNGHLYNSLFHFTDADNIPSIKEQGLLSKLQAKEKGTKIVRYGGNQWSHDADTLKKLEDYVNLCFTRSHPMSYIAHMEGRIPTPKYLSVDPDVLKIDGVKITLGVANMSGVELLNVEDGLENLDTEVLYTRTDWNNPGIQERLLHAEKCEILVPKHVPLEMIKF